LLDLAGAELDAELGLDRDDQAQDVHEPFSLAYERHEPLDLGDEPGAVLIADQLGFLETAGNLVNVG
jgi:hypothetical protein